jgi:hypothetical protein
MEGELFKRGVVKEQGIDRCSVVWVARQSSASAVDTTGKGGAVQVRHTSSEGGAHPVLQRLHSCIPYLSASHKANKAICTS